MEIISPDQVGKDALMAFVVAIIATLIVACITSCSTRVPMQTIHKYDIVKTQTTKYDCTWTQKLNK